MLEMCWNRVDVVVVQHCEYAKCHGIFLIKKFEVYLAHISFIVQQQFDISIHCKITIILTIIHFM